MNGMKKRKLSKGNRLNEKPRCKRHRGVTIFESSDELDDILKRLLQPINSRENSASASAYNLAIAPLRTNEYQKFKLICQKLIQAETSGERRSVPLAETQIALLLLQPLNGNASEIDITAKLTGLNLIFHLNPNDKRRINAFVECVKGTVSTIQAINEEDAASIISSSSGTVDDLFEDKETDTPVLGSSQGQELLRTKKYSHSRESSTDSETSATGSETSLVSNQSVVGRLSP